MNTERDDGAGRVTVIIPAYNAAPYIAATLKSVYAQTLQPAEVIVVDDGSSDDTVAVARSFGATIISLANGGPSSARNAGTRAAQTEYVAYVDADDLWSPEKLARQIAALRGYGRPAFSVTDFRLFDERGFHPHLSEMRRHPAFRKIVGNPAPRTTVVIAADDRRPVLPEMYLLQSSVVARRADVLAIGGYDVTLRLCEDYEFLLRLFRIVPAVAVMESLMFYRRHVAQATAAPIAMTSGLFAVEQRVNAASERYPSADARYILKKGLLHHRIGLWYVRLGQFDEAVDSFKQSLAARWTLRTALTLLAALIGRWAPVRYGFNLGRAVWRSRPKRRGALSELQSPPV